MFCFLNPAVHFVTETVVHAQSSRGFPGVLKIEIVGLAPNRGFIKLVSNWGQACGSRHCVGKRCRRQKSSEGVRQRISRLDIMLPARGMNQHGRIGRAASKSV